MQAATPNPGRGGRRAGGAAAMVADCRPGRSRALAVRQDTPAAGLRQGAGRAVDAVLNEVLRRRLGVLSKHAGTGRHDPDC